MVRVRMPLLLLLLAQALPGCAEITAAVPYALSLDDDDVVDDDDSGGDDDDSTGDDDDAVGPCDDSFLTLSDEVVSFSGDVVPLLGEFCQPCHIVQTRGNLALNEFEAYSQLVDQLNSLGYQDLVRVAPGEAEASYMMHKIMPCGDTDPTWGYLQGPMPPPFPGLEPLTEEQINLIYSWILQGALDN